MIMSVLTYLAKYFDLRDPFPFQRTTGTPSEPVSPSTTPLPSTAPPPSGTARSGVGWQIATYLLVLVSIVASRFCDLYRAGALGSFKLDAPYLLFVGIVSLTAFPVVYNKAALSPDDPVFMRIALI